MNLEAEILKEHSKKQTLKIVDYIGNDKHRFATLMDLFLEGGYRITQRSAWAVSCCAEKHPELIIPWLEKIIDNLGKPLHDAVKRNTVRILQDLDIPEKLQGKVADKCFHFLASRKEPVAVKVFSMTVLGNLCIKEPALANELKLLIEEQLPYATPGFLSRARKVLKQLKDN